MKVLIVAGSDKLAQLADAITAEFEFERATDVPGARELLANDDFDGLLLHLDIGAAAALDLFGQLNRGAKGQMPGVVVIAREVDTRSVVNLMRAGALDVLVEGAMEPREISHALRNAAFCAQARARLSGKRSAPPSQEVLVVGTGDSVEAIVLLLEASGISVRHVAELSHVSAGQIIPRAIVLDLAAAGDAETLSRLLKPAN